MVGAGEIPTTEVDEAVTTMEGMAIMEGVVTMVIGGGMVTVEDGILAGILAPITEITETDDAKVVSI